MQRRGESSMLTKVFAGIGIASVVSFVIVVLLAGFAVFLFVASGGSDTVDAPSADNIGFLAGEQCSFNCAQSKDSAYRFWQTSPSDEGFECACLDAQQSPISQSFISDASLVSASLQESEAKHVSELFEARCKSQCRASVGVSYGFTYSARYNPSANSFLCECTDGETNQLVSDTALSYSDLKSELARAEEVAPYIDPIETSNIQFRQIAAQVASDCPDNDHACETNAVYRYVVENYKYRSDPLTQIVQTPGETVQVGAGDCEDFTILMNSLLENLGIETGVALTSTHAYGVACGIDRASLEYYANLGRLEYIAKRNTKDDSDKSVVRGGKLYRVVTDDLSFSTNDGRYVYLPLPQFTTDQTASAMIRYKVKAPFSVDVMFLESINEVSRVQQGQNPRQLSRCAKVDAFNPEGECSDLPGGAVILVQNVGGSSQEQLLNVKVERWFEYGPSLLPEPVQVTTYNLDGRECVALDGTAGPNGYPGFDANIEDDKIIVSTIGRQVWDFAR